MALAAFGRPEPEVARFIDTYKFDQDMAVKRDRFGGGTSLPLNSDGYEDKQQALRDERHKDWLYQQDKQRQAEQQKLEARRHAPPPRPAQPPGPQMDYNLAGEQAKAEERRAYQDYMKAKEERYWAMRGRPVTPPGGLNIGNYDRQVKEQAQAKKEEYKKMLDEQQREHMFLRARQEPEMAVLDRHGQPPQYLANKPPPGPGYSRGRDEAYKTESQSRPIPERHTYGQPPYPGVSLNQSDERFNPDASERRKSPSKFQPRSPEKPVDRDLLRVPPKDNERQSELGTPLAFKTEPPRQSVPEKPRFNQDLYPELVLKDPNEGRYNPAATGRPRSPVDLQPRSPEKPPNVEWLKRPVRDDERQPGLGTPLAFKTNSYSRQPPPAPEQGYSRKPPSEQGYSRQPPPAPKQGYSGQQLPPAHEQSYRGPPFSSEGRMPLRKYENGAEGLFGKPEDYVERPKSRRSLDADRRTSPSKKENVAITANKISPRRMKNTQYTETEEVSTKRREASKERQKEYNELLRMQAEKRRQDEDMFRQQQQQSKPAEVVKNPFYSSDDYEKFQKELNRKQGEEYREFLSQKKAEVRNRDWNFDQTGVLELHGDDAVQSRQRELRAERKQDYNEYISQQKMTNPGRRHDFVDTASGPYGGLFHGLGEHGNRSDDLNKERQKEYNERLDQKYAGKDRPSGRPKWVQDSLPNNTDRGRSPMKTQPPADQYQQMLNEKRREEANLRRFEDPEYQDRLSRGRDRGADGPRDMDVEPHKRQHWY